ncbi:hypothetical protein QO002_001419 [Pararhizobium capsulatum DSM 1112]|uniref:DUF937 domain-containing protein n=1 Tax=Pararhizobium capsulatum DSM 1112 TaxID=1121113 RepID=A0ABU0BNN9_9HYPH|nr:DUF937 domain-containing protein [Pararhizobium capsulatum]MDQ0319281.1 hypothetical protein [Pararhizobium capsulatum DSM 1112]
MLPLFDMMMQAHNGQAMEVMARQFGLAQEQMAKATAALMPAFSTALKRNAANPYDFGAFLTAMTSGNHAQYFEDMSKAFTPQGMADGNGILGQLFGSKEMSRAIAAQAAQMTGIGQEIYKQMLPVMASALMGGLFKQATDQMTGKSNPFANNAFAPMMQSWLEAAGFTRKPEPTLNPFDNPFTQAMQAFLQPKPAEKKPEAAEIFASNPFMKAFQDMMAASGAPAQKEKPVEKSVMAPFTEMVGSMFDSGIEAQKEYQKAIDGLFETYRTKTQE